MTINEREIPLESLKNGDYIFIEYFESTGDKVYSFSKVVRKLQDFISVADFWSSECDTDPHVRWDFRTSCSLETCDYRVIVLLKCSDRETLEKTAKLQYPELLI